MYSKLTVCNGALQKIGVTRIMSLDENSKESKICLSEYEKVRMTVLRLYPWSFASARVKLAPDPVQPAFEYEYAFELPTDYLRVVEVFDYDGAYRVEGTQMLMNSNELSLKYVKNVQDITRADSLFIDALEWYLGYTIARYLVESETVREEALKGFRQIMPMAKFVQSTEHSQPDFQAYDLVEARYGSGFVRDPGTH